ncbi:MAG: hypothetical protein A2Z20_02870 [Bdellovibrionales bacterium RBG_16_40_8]|nr:MAG: hypothetical protein A2Z20_02870 [Bdellovibrionales bacterium RBG_16_40_8]
MRRMRFNLVLLVILIGFFTTSCTRSLTKSTSISLVLPSGDSSNKVSSLEDPSPGDLSLTHFIANVSGPGINPVIFFSWDSHDGRNIAPKSFIIDVPGGENRLVQVLAVYKTNVSSSEQFYYGDASAAITQDTSLTVPISLLNTTAGEGRIVGHWSDTSSGAPTGKIVLKYTPVNTSGSPNKPTMTIHHSEIFGGFFNVFALKDMKFDYELPGGVKMFGGSINIDSPSLYTATTTKIYVPRLYKRRGDTPATYELKEQTEIVVGWFGSGALASKKVCYPNTPNDLRDAYQDSNGATPVLWDYTSSDVSINTSKAHPISSTATGGVASNDIDATELLCKSSSTGTRYVDYLSIDSFGLGEQDQALTFKGPYITKFNSNYRSAFDVTYSSGLIMTWEYLPGVKSTLSPAYKGVDGSDVFLKISTQNPDPYSEAYRIDDGFDCGHLTSVYGFSLLKSAPYQDQDANEIITATLSDLPAGFATAYNEGRVTLILCPYANTLSGKSYFKSGVDYRSYGSGGQ